ncbi:hypothetical protein Ahy_A06g028644 [Arachis hypogaea]|uniref:Transposase MuDR plant domain-containing protein n=1 Tax=Arachis hypogaea TaxID=3818 RepID=A0A445CRF9_ARAHY|nr:hypothetical protein Ahy_A06g028644 [Arachis hypogaea]
MESDRSKYHVHCKNFVVGCPWSLHVCKFGGSHTCFSPTMSQDHRQFDSNLICSVILSLVQSNPSVTISILQGVVAKQKAIAQIYGDLNESYNKMPRLLQALQSCCPKRICDFSTVSYYDGHLVVRDYS